MSQHVDRTEFSAHIHPVARQSVPPDELLVVVEPAPVGGGLLVATVEHAVWVRMPARERQFAIGMSTGVALTLARELERVAGAADRENTEGYR